MHTFRQLALTTSLRPDQIVELITSQATICLCDNTISELYFSNKRTAPNELIVAPSSKRRRVKNTSTFASASESASPNPNASTASSAYCGSFRILLDWYSDNIILSPEILPTPSCSTCGHTFDVSIDFSVTDYSVHFCVNKATDLFSAWKDLAEPPVTVQTPREQWRTRDDLLFDTLGKLYKKGKVELRRPRLVLTFGHGGTPQFHADFEMHALLPAKDWALRDLLSLLFSPPPFDNVTGDMDVTMFYSALQPPVSSCIPVGAQPNELEPTLMPFQAQAVLWMLNREGMTLNKDGKLVPHVHNHARDLPLVWSKVHTDKGTELLVNRHTGEVLTEAPQSFEEEFEDEDGVLGGILSEEMGLGKTVEMLALILHHRPTDPVTEPSFVTEHNKNLRATGATLIITPNAILSQWVSEIKTHAPSLRYFVYDGASSKSGRDITVEDLLAYDIVLTTYPILSKEVYYARKLLDRPRRTTQKYLPRRSPLVKILWWRVLLDEAQMIESTVTKTAEMALLIPRVHPWAVTGTPIKTNFHDLHGLFAFLRLEPLASTPYLLPMLLSPVSRAALLAFCRRVVYRNSKQAVRAQLDIPPQHRQVVHVSFSRIELHYYEELFEQCCLEIDLDWLDEQGWTLPGVDEVETYAERDKLRDRMEVARGKMRAWLLRLRQTCCHPGIGAQNQKQLGGTLHTVTEVLAVMYRQCISKILTLDHQLANTKFRGAALMELQEQFEPALRMYEVGLKFVQQKVAETRDRLAGKKGKRALKRAEGGADVDVEGARKRRGREDDDGGVEGEKEDDDGGVEDDRVGRIDEAGDDVESLSVGLHHWLEAEHKFLFFIASVNHQLERTEKETEFYELAEGLRRELLRPMEKKFDAALREIAPKIMTVKTADFSYSTLTGGILSWDIIERADDFAERLNGQRHIVDTWRGKIFDTLTAKLVDQDADPDGEEYQGSLELQESGAAYQEAYSKLLADRRYIITGIWNALYLGDDFWGPVVKKKNRAGLEKELEDQREEFSPKKNTEPHLKDLVLELRQALQRLYITEKEEHIIDAELARIGRDVDAQTRVLSVLEKECEDFRKLYNIRIEYYRQLQAISDQVRVVESKNPEREGKAIQTQEADLERQMATQTSRRRYLEHLVEMNSKGVEEMDEEERMCLICRNDFIQGAITVCGHMFCEACLKAWVSVHRKCPTCTGRVGPSEWQRIVWKKPATTASTSTVSAASPASTVSIIPDEEISAIHSVKIKSGLGVKLDTIIRHIKHIKNTTGAKCLIFSQWSQVLDLLWSGLRKNDINCVKFHGARMRKESLQQFKNDPDMTVFLLHARSQSSGLTLVAAQHVFMCEPLVNLGLESQAINRVHRIGQIKQTYVHWYVVRDTIEERVYAIHEARKITSLSKNRRMPVFASRKGKEKATDNNTLSQSVTDLDLVEALNDPKQTALESVRYGGGGEYVMDEDLRRCFTKKEDWIVGIEGGDRPTFTDDANKAMPME